MSDTEAELVSGEEIARWLGLSGKEIYDLGKAGILVRVGRTYRLQESVRRYCHYPRQEPAKDNAEPISAIDAKLGPRTRAASGNYPESRTRPHHRR
jgi:hypothetical protein